VGGLSDFDLEGRVSLAPEAGGEAVPAVPAVPIVGQVRGSTLFRLRPGSIEVRGLTARVGTTEARADGLFSSDALDLETRIISEDLRDMAFLYENAGGSGRFEGRVAGSMERPEVDGDFALAGFTFRGERIDRIEGGLSYGGDRVDLRNVSVRVGSASLAVDGSVGVDLSGPDLDVRFERLDAGQLSPFIGDSFGEHTFGGTFEGRIRVTSLDPIEFDGQVEARGLIYDEHPLGDGRANLAYGSDLVLVTDASVDREDARASGTLRLDRIADTLELALVLRGHRLEDYHWAGIPEALQGTLREANVAVSGSLSEPRVEGQAALEDLRLGRQSFPVATFEVETTGRRVHVSVETDEHLEIDMEVDASGDGLPLNGMASFSEFDIGQLAGLGPRSILATGSTEFAGLLLDLSTLEGDGEVISMTAAAQGQLLEVTRPFDFSFDTRRVDVSRVELIGGEATSVELNGTIAIGPDAPLDLNVRGPIELSAFGGRYEGLTVSGGVLLDAWVQGTASEPELGGTATLAGVSLAHEGVFLGLSNLNGDIFLDGPRATLNLIRGTLGGGAVTLNGTVGISGASRGVIDVRADTSDIRVRTLSGLRAVFGGTFGLRGTMDLPVLEGDVELVSLTYDESFEQFLQLFDRGVGAPGAPGPLDNMALAVHVEGDRNIRVENELASLDSRVDLDVGGTFGSPSLTGHGEILRGTLDLQGRRYRITRGNVDFVDPVGIDPRIDIQAEADIRDYRVILLITGQGDDIQLTMRSDPALPQLEIVSLVAGGRTREELDREGRVSEEQLFQGAASNILADMLQSRVGSRLGVLNSVRIDPFLVGAENDPVARLTIAEQITSDLEITYSQDLSSNTQQVIQIEYFLNGDTSFIASRDESGRLGLDIKLRKRFD
jgi:translocation and assembly module TamB